MKKGNSVSTENAGMSQGPHGQKRTESVWRSKFRICAHCIASAAGEPWAFGIALASVVVWAVTGPFFHYSDTWQLVINTATTVVTFLMVFLIQNTQNRDTKAVHLKLDELLRAVGPARTSLVNLESFSDEELERLQKEFERLNLRARRRDHGGQAAGREG